MSPSFPGSPGKPMNKKVAECTKFIILLIINYVLPLSPGRPIGPGRP